MLLIIHWILAWVLCIPLLIGAFEEGQFPPTAWQVRRYFAYYYAALAINLGYYIHLAYRWDKVATSGLAVISVLVVAAGTIFLLFLKPWKGGKRDRDY